ncbi:MAG: hypothetical protein CMJ34_05625 [Phycisphaerae bacterium]|nr:hypothetical protein [Phycisphaerae bacterium]
MPEAGSTSVPRGTRRAWGLVVLAVAFEIGWATCLPFTEGFSRPLWTTGVVLLMIASLLPLASATRILPIGPAYAVWTGSGAAGTAVLGWLVHDDPATLLRIAGIALVVAGVVGLRLFQPRGGHP